MSKERIDQLLRVATLKLILLVMMGLSAANRMITRAKAEARAQCRRRLPGWDSWRSVAAERQSNNQRKAKILVPGQAGQRIERQRKGCENGNVTRDD
jgi:hypothetical protein